jgi:DNA adenine methylase
MRLGFNGIWQTCKDAHGLFGTPAGLLNQRTLSQILDTSLLSAWSRALADVTIHSGSYDGLVLPTTGKSLIYLDPPYRDSFTHYSTGFNDTDQIALCDWFIERAKEGHKVLLANRSAVGDSFFTNRLKKYADFTYIDVVYTAGRRKKTESGFEAKVAREFLAISRG